MESYHRLDLSASFTWGKTDNHKFTVGVYNAYSHKNPFFYFFDTKWNSNGRGKRVLKKISLFPILPALSYTYKF